MEHPHRLNVTLSSILDGVPGAYERVRLGLEQARAGETISLDELLAYSAPCEPSQISS